MERMDLVFHGFLFLSTILGYFANGDVVETTGDTRAYMGHRVQLPCKYTVSSGNSDWMFMRWKRNTTIIATMQNNVFSADWSSSVPENFRDHVELHKRIGDDEYSLDLIIDGFLCTDVGTYICEVFTMSSATALSSSTKLDIEVHPGTPTINDNIIEVKENDTFKLECNADVGTPPQTITWAYALKDASYIYLKAVDGVVQENTEGPDCTFRGSSVLSVQMTKELDGAIYMCSTSSELADDGKPVNFDEVQIILFGKTTTTPSTTTSTTIKAQYSSDDITGAASSSVASNHVIFIICSLLTVFRAFARRT